MADAQPLRPLRVAGLFAGIAGMERGLHQAGHRTVLFCEILESAQRVLRKHYPSVTIESDVRQLRRLPDVDLVTAGFPCQDLSQAGKTKGIRGRESGLVAELFRLLEDSDPRWVLIENVPFMLALQRGAAMSYLVERLEGLGFGWAYRILDSRAFGLPQRRQRVILLASRSEDPRTILLTEDAGEPATPSREGLACGFYWTEGSRGLGWAVDAVPTLKGGSTIGIPSPPGIWMPDGAIGTPSIRDAERLQGFPAGWTRSASLGAQGRSKSDRWKLVGNAVSVPVAKWIGQRLRRPTTYDAGRDQLLGARARWPTAAWSVGEGRHAANVSAWPVHRKRRHLHEFWIDDLRPLSTRATAGFLSRAEAGNLHFEDGFLDDVRTHLRRMERCSVVV